MRSVMALVLPFCWFSWFLMRIITNTHTTYFGIPYLVIKTNKNAFRSSDKIFMRARLHTYMHIHCVHPSYIYVDICITVHGSRCSFIHAFLYIFIQFVSFRRTRTSLAAATTITTAATTFSDWFEKVVSCVHWIKCTKKRETQRESEQRNNI